MIFFDKWWKRGGVKPTDEAGAAEVRGEEEQGGAGGIRPTDSACEEVVAEKRKRTRGSGAGGDQSSSSSTEPRELDFWYSVTRPSKKFCSFLMSIISASQGSGFCTPGQIGVRPTLSSRRSAM